MNKVLRKIIITKQCNIQLGNGQGNSSFNLEYNENI